TTAKVKKVDDEVRIQVLVDGKRVNIKESSIRRTLRLDDAEGTFCLTNAEIFKGLARMGKLVFCKLMHNPYPSLLKRKHKPKRKHIKKPKVPSTESQAEQNIPLPSPSHDPLPSGEDSMKLKKLMNFCTNLSNKVLDLESEIIDADVEINLEKVQAEAYNLDLDHQEKVLSMMDVNDEEPADVEEVLEVVKAAKLFLLSGLMLILLDLMIPIQLYDLDLAKIKTIIGKIPILKTLPIIATEATKVGVPRNKRGVIIQDPEETTTTVTVQLKVQAKDKRKAILVEEPKPLKRERFAKTEPKKYSDDFLLNTLKIMVEKPNVEANMWKDQKGKYGLAKVKKRKLFESCGVYCLILSTTHIFLLIERMYHLTHFTLEQMMNDVRLEVEDESEMSLELLRLVKRQLNEGYVP
nr:hypothetical protein [Tanacetum cinerariifolium]